MKITYFDLLFIIFLIFSGGCRKRAVYPGSPVLANPIEIEHVQTFEEGYKSIDFAASIRSKFRAFSSIQNFKNIYH